MTTIFCLDIDSLLYRLILHQHLSSKLHSSYLLQREEVNQSGCTIVLHILFENHMHVELLKWITTSWLGLVKFRKPHHCIGVKIRPSVSDVQSTDMDSTESLEAVKSDKNLWPSLFMAGFASLGPCVANLTPFVGPLCLLTFPFNCEKRGRRNNTKGKINSEVEGTFLLLVS